MRSPEQERILAEAAVLRLRPSGTKTPSPWSQELRFVYEDGAIYLLAPLNLDPDPSWAASLHPGEIIEMQLGGERLHARAEPLGEGDTDVSDVLALLRDKYGMQLVKVWYESGRYVPVLLRLEPSISDS